MNVFKHIQRIILLTECFLEDFNKVYSYKDCILTTIVVMAYVVKGKLKLVGYPPYALEIPNKTHKTLLVDIYTIRPDPRDILERKKSYECSVIYDVCQPYRISIKMVKGYKVFSIV